MADAEESVPIPTPEKLPWHESSWKTLTRDLERLPHALLLHGQAGIGKNHFALRLAQFVLCLDRAGADHACGRCHSCALFRVGNHPDLLRVAPLEDSSIIAVDQVRGVSEFLALKGHTSPFKVVVISPAQAMNVNAANSLLKALEEPPPRSLIVLVTSHLSRVPITIRSRCVRVSFQAPSWSQAIGWLKEQNLGGTEFETRLSEAGGAPLSVRSATERESDRRAELLADLAAMATRKADPIRCAERWKSIGTDKSLEWFYRLLVETLRRQAPSPEQRVVSTIPGISHTFSINFIDLFVFLDNISNIKKQIGTGIDETLALEDLMIRWSEIATNAG
jgi:DNA polymerase-3 subunit delta'